MTDATNDMNRFSYSFESKSNEELAELFNNQVRNGGWGPARAHFFATLRQELQDHQIDISEIINSSGGVKLKKKAKLVGNKMVLVAD